MTVAGAGSYADGVRIRFNPHLNCVVGSGGKSTVIRILAYAFGVVGFMKTTRKPWLPDLVRVFWREGEDIYCVERRGRYADPNHDGVEVRWLRRLSSGAWEPKTEERAEILRELPKRVDIWPPVDVLEKKQTLSRFEGKIIDDLVDHLRIGHTSAVRPLLVNQPREIFNTRKLFGDVLARPHLKGRQIIWSTGSANVPTALDAEKIIVTRETRRGKQMEVAYGGDLHEDEIRTLFLDQLEGGWTAFARRHAMYLS